MRVLLRNLDDNVCPVDIEPTDDFVSLTAKVQKKTGIDPSRQKMLYHGIQLWAFPSRTMSDHNMQEGHTIHIIHHGPLELRAN